MFNCRELDKDSLSSVSAQLLQYTAFVDESTSFIVHLKTKYIKYDSVSPYAVKELTVFARIKLNES